MYLITSNFRGKGWPWIQTARKRRFIWTAGIRGCLHTALTGADGPSTRPSELRYAYVTRRRQLVGRARERELQLDAFIRTISTKLQNGVFSSPHDRGGPRTNCYLSTESHNHVKNYNASITVRIYKKRQEPYLDADTLDVAIRHLAGRSPLLLFLYRPG